MYKSNKREEMKSTHVTKFLKEKWGFFNVLTALGRTVLRTLSLRK